MTGRLARVALAVGGLVAAMPLAAQAQCVVNSQNVTQASGAGTVIGVGTPGPGCLVNNATVTTIPTGFGANTYTLFVNGDGSITNNGSAVTIAGSFQSNNIVFVNGSGSIVNNGTVTGTIGGFAFLQGLEILNNGTITNNGTVAVTATGGFTSVAAVFGGGTVTVVNAGTLTASGAATSGVTGVDIQAGAIINTGSVNAAVTAPFGNATGLLIETSGIIANTGTVTATGPNNIAIRIEGANSSITNAGGAIAPGGTAIELDGGNSTLTLLPGSFVLGNLVVAGSGNTINLDAGNQNLTFTSLAGATVTSNLPHVVAGNQVVTIDPTPFGLADTNLMDFTRAVSGMLETLGGNAGPSGPLASAFAPSGGIAATVDGVFAGFPGLGYADDQTMVFKAPTRVTADGRAVWARGFGGERTQDAQDGLAGAHTAFFGGAVGFDMVARRDLRLGLFAGGGESRLSLDGNLGSTSSDMAFGGVYGRWNFASPLGRDSFLDFALHGGGGSNSTARTINNNLAAGGLEIATAHYNTSYITPELKYGVNIPLWARYTLTPSVGVRYVAGFFGGYTEAGSTANLTVASRTIQDFEERGEVKLTHATPIGPDLLLTSVHVGAIGLERAGDTTVDATLLGINLPFVTPGKNTVGGLLGGAGFAWRTREGVSFFGAGEAIGFSDSSTVWSAKGGVRVAF